MGYGKTFSMIDFHNHLIPQIDDGSKSIEMSIDMLLEAQKQGITDVVSTIHYQHPKMDGKNTEYSFVNDKRLQLQQILDKKKINIKIHLGAEVFYLPNLTKILDNPIVTIGDGKFMLIEFQTKMFPPSYLLELYKVQEMGITPVIAHPERYLGVQENPKLCGEWINRGFVLQLDCGSILGHFKTKCKETAIKLIQEGYIQLIGSDAHNNKKRNFCLKPAYDYIEELFGIDVVKKMKNNSSLLLDGKKPQIIRSADFKYSRKSKKGIIDKIVSLINRRKK